ncbi:hypothetical protein [Nitrosospira sp. Nsp1]|uniref:hypothetical protein n=1 Tax=Nitrosospira sp. Nsp1 TaxID=136547 RepID=UPI00088A18D7|nr:hypothetical protein [Nitrosospira sp. Nsp1]SCX59424.1 hypothetical protein SAMN05720354_12330 [Nitrosospira sp. Nsp1]
MNIYLIYSVTALGIFLSLFWMFFIFRGRSIPGTHTITWGKIEIKTTTVLGVLTASLATAVLPLSMQFYMQVNKHSFSSETLANKQLLEGEWLFKSSYEKYYDEPKPNLLFGKGNAVMLWKHDQKRYDIYLSYGVHRSGGAELLSSDSDLLAATIKGLLFVDEEGALPPQNFTMGDFVILTRLHFKSYPPSMRTYQFTNCYVGKKTQTHVDTIRCDFETPQTKSKVEFTWNGPLH